MSESIGKLAKKTLRAEGKLKEALVMHFRRVDLQDALRISDDADQFVRAAIGEAEPA